MQNREYHIKGSYRQNAALSQSPDEELRVNFPAGSGVLPNKVRSEDYTRVMKHKNWQKTCQADYGPSST
jgi:hypothetical protein